MFYIATAEIPAKTRRPFLLLSTPLQHNIKQAFDLLPSRPVTLLNNERSIVTSYIQRVAVGVYAVALVVNAFRLGFRGDGACKLHIYIYILFMSFDLRCGPLDGDAGDTAYLRCNASIAAQSAFPVGCHQPVSVSTFPSLHFV